MPTATGSTVSSRTARTLHLMMRTITYAETIRLIAPGEGGSISEAFKAAHAELARHGIVRHLGPLMARARIEDLEEPAKALLSALENSPLPEAEWAPMNEIFNDGLTNLLGISPSSLTRYRSGERSTPDQVAARLHVVAMIVADLAGSYNDFGIRRWFQRPRTALAGRAPNEILTGAWAPDTEDVTRVQDLARSLLGAAGG